MSLSLTHTQYPNPSKMLSFKKVLYSSDVKIQSDLVKRPSICFQPFRKFKKHLRTARCSVAAHRLSFSAFPSMLLQERQKNLEMSSAENGFFVFERAFRESTARFLWCKISSCIRLSCQFVLGVTMPSKEFFVQGRRWREHVWSFVSSIQQFTIFTAAE